MVYFRIQLIRIKHCLYFTHLAPHTVLYSPQSVESICSPHPKLIKLYYESEYHTPYIYNIINVYCSPFPQKTKGKAEKQIFINELNTLVLRARAL